jgi:undecaprenyl-phosphate galactose phosphotransferase
MLTSLTGWLSISVWSICCVAWYSVRLRHYFYRKTFWFELKEILRTLVIFAVIEIAVMAFPTGIFTFYLEFTWLFVLLLVPSLRMLSKKCIDLMGLWRRETVIIGSGNNAIEAWKAIDSEKNLGFRVISFITRDRGKIAINDVDNISIIEQPKELKEKFDKRTQFIVALNHMKVLRNDWLSIYD